VGKRTIWSEGRWELGVQRGMTLSRHVTNLRFKIGAGDPQEQDFPPASIRRDPGGPRRCTPVGHQVPPLSEARA
jgi:hypothetical protein